MRDEALVEWANKTFRVKGLLQTGGPEMEMLIGVMGRPRYVRHRFRFGVTFEDYTDRPAFSCEGVRLGGERLVIEYSADNQGEWTATARGSSHTSFPEFYNMLAGRLESGPLGKLDGHLARAVVGTGRISSESALSIPPGRKHYLWLDVKTLLPLKWELVRDGVPSEYGLSFEYDPSLHLEPPAAIPTPTCVRD